MAILTTAEFKTLAGITDSSHDAKIAAFLPLVDDAIRQYTERDFTTADVGATRTYRWDGRGAVEIDDCKTITAVTLDGNALTLGTQYVPGPDLEERYYWLELPRQRGWSTEMGFTWNADMYGSIWPNNFPVDVAVTATFGYPTSEVPGSVKLAAYLALSTVVSGPEDDNLQSEAIDSYARSWDTINEADRKMSREFLPDRALALLDPFCRRSGGA